MEEARWGAVFPVYESPVLMLRADCSLFTLFTNSSYEMPSRIALRLLCIVFSHLYTPQLAAHHQAQVFDDRPKGQRRKVGQGYQDQGRPDDHRGEQQ